MVKSEQDQNGVLITLSPNRSATWQQTKWVIFVMVFIVMVIALAWSFVGAWIVLPFAGAEVGLFALLMYKVSKFTYSNQTIHVREHQVSIASGYRKHRQIVDLHRKSLHVYYSETDNHWHLPLITFRSDEESIVVGNFLNLEDRQELKQVLETVGFRILKNKWWQS